MLCTIDYFNHYLSLTDNTILYFLRYNSLFESLLPIHQKIYFGGNSNSKSIYDPSGSGIFVSPKGVLERSGSVGLSLLIWTGSGVISLLGKVDRCPKHRSISLSFIVRCFMLRRIGNIDNEVWCRVLIHLGVIRRSFGFPLLVDLSVCPEAGDVGHHLHDSKRVHNPAILHRVHSQRLGNQAHYHIFYWYVCQF